MSGLVYTHDVAFAALCIMEEMIDPVSASMPKPWSDYWTRTGVAQMRELALELAPHADAAWQRAYARYEDQRQQPGLVEDPGSFDYDFIPVWLRHCVDWDADKPCVRSEAILAEAGATKTDTTENVGLSDTLEPKLACPSCGDSHHLYDRADVRYDPETREWVVGDSEGSIDCTECDWSGQESDLARVGS